MGNYRDRSKWRFDGTIRAAFLREFVGTPLIGGSIDGNPMLTFMSSNATITPSITLSGGGPCQWEVTEVDGTKYYYSANSFSHTRSVVGNMTVRLLNTMQVAPYVTSYDFNSDGIISNYQQILLNIFTNLSSSILLGNNVIGDLSQLVFLPAYRFIYFSSTALTGSITDLQLNTGLVYLYLTGGVGLTGSIASWVLPTSLQRLRVNSNANVSGNWSTLTLNSALQWFHGESTSATGGPVIPASTALQQYFIQNCGLTQTAVDAIVTNVYTNRAGFTYATPTFNIGGTNANPSGVYQNPFPNPPATPLEMIYVLVNDPFTEGFNKQVWTY